jgi:RNA polymerase sigma-70 factor (ECF subfamily)
MEREAVSKREEFEREALVHLDTLYNVALRLVGSASDAEDLVQEAVTKAWRAWDKYEQGTNCRAWLVTILRNTFINQFRRASR